MKVAESRGRRTRSVDSPSSAPTPEPRRTSPPPTPFVIRSPSLGGSSPTHPAASTSNLSRPTSSPPARSRASEVESVLDREPTFDVAIHWVCEGWPADIDRAIAAFSANAGSRRLQFVVADVTGVAADRWADRDDVEVVWLRDDTGWAAARNAGTLAVACADRDRGRRLDRADRRRLLVRSRPRSRIRRPVCVGPFGIVSEDLREFRESSGAGLSDAIEGYLMAFRRDLLSDRGRFDEKFRCYRRADIDLSFRVKDPGPGGHRRPGARRPAMRTGCGLTPPEDRAPACRSGTSTGSSIAGAAATTSWFGRTPATTPAPGRHHPNNPFTVLKSVDDQRSPSGSAGVGGGCGLPLATVVPARASRPPRLPFGLRESSSPIFGRWGSVSLVHHVPSRSSPSILSLTMSSADSLPSRSRRLDQDLLGARSCASFSRRLTSWSMTSAVCPEIFGPR